MEFELLMKGPYDLTRCALAFSKFPLDGTDVWITPRETLPAEYRRLHVVDDEPILVMVQQDPGARRRTSPADRPHQPGPAPKVLPPERKSHLAVSCRSFPGRVLPEGEKAPCLPPLGSGALRGETPTSFHRL